MTSHSPLVSVIIPNWNGERFILECLASVRAQSHAPIETVLVDDASTDGSVDLVAGLHPEVLIARLPRNRGFAHAVNTGVRLARGQLVLLLNNDAVADAHWVAELVGAAGRHREAGSFASKILLMDRPHVINSAGDLYLRTGRPESRGVWEDDDGQYDEEGPVFGACGAAACYRRDMLDRIGPFDERLYMYCEDVDLALRAQLAGYGCIYVPKAVVRHRLSASGGGTLASYQCARNMLWLLARDVPWIVWRQNWRSIVSSQLELAWGALRHAREPAARARLRGMIDGLLTAPALLAQRRAFASVRCIPDDQVTGLFA